MRILSAIYRIHLQRLHFTAPIIITLMLKEILHWGLMMLAVFLPALFKIHMVRFGPLQDMICGTYGLINVKIVLNKATDAIAV